MGEAEFAWSVAKDTWTDGGGVVYVVGYGFNLTTSREEALMWVVPEPASLLALGLGLAALALRRRK
jgi:hypothetical protein